MADFNNIELLREQIAELLDKALSAGDPQKAAEYVKQSTEILKLYNDELDRELQHMGELMKHDDTLTLVDSSEIQVKKKSK